MCKVRRGPTQERGDATLRQTSNFDRELPADVRESGKCCSTHAEMGSKQLSVGDVQLAVRVHTDMERRDDWYNLRPCDLESHSAHSGP